MPRTVIDLKPLSDLRCTFPLGLQGVVDGVVGITSVCLTLKPFGAECDSRHPQGNGIRIPLATSLVVLTV